MTKLIELPAGSALLVIDVQKAIDDPIWSAEAARNNPDPEATIASLLPGWRGRGWPVIHVHHDSTFPASPYRPGQPGNGFNGPRVRQGQVTKTEARQTPEYGRAKLDLLRARLVARA
jgi:nicotinamidase-related amidase